MLSSMPHCHLSVPGLESHPGFIEFNACTCLVVLRSSGNAIRGSNSYGNSIPLEQAGLSSGHSTLSLQSPYISETACRALSMSDNWTVSHTSISVYPYCLSIYTLNVPFCQICFLFSTLIFYALHDLKMKWKKGVQPR